MRKQLFAGILIGSVTSTLVVMAAPAIAGSGIGAVFNLGKTNTVNAQSALKGATSGKSLQLTNTGSGGGLGITVGSGKAPITVNASAGKASNLNADKLDGVDSTGFVRTAELYRFAFNESTGNADIFSFGPLVFTASCLDDGGGQWEANIDVSTTATNTVVNNQVVNPNGTVHLDDNTGSVLSTQSVTVTAYASTTFQVDGTVVAAVHTPNVECRFFGHLVNDAG